MLKTFVTPVLIVLSLAGAAGAQSLSADLQLASAAGVSVGRYTAAELQVIAQARQDNDTTTLNFYLSGQNRVTGKVTDAGGQLAKQAGVADGQYTVAELIRIQNAKATNDSYTLAYYLSGQDRVAAAPASVVTPGKAQIAASLGVDPAAYTLSELATLARKADASQ